MRVKVLRVSSLVDSGWTDPGARCVKWEKSTRELGVAGACCTQRSLSEWFGRMYFDWKLEGKTEVNEVDRS